MKNAIANDPFAFIVRKRERPHSRLANDPFFRSFVRPKTGLKTTVLVHRKKWPKKHEKNPFWTTFWVPPEQTNERE